jgi:hypothetical protein
LADVGEGGLDSREDAADGIQVDRDRVVGVLALPSADDVAHDAAEIERATRGREGEDVIRAREPEPPRLHGGPRGARLVDQFGALAIDANPGVVDERAGIVEANLAPHVG